MFKLFCIVQAINLKYGCDFDDIYNNYLVCDWMYHMHVIVCK